jgi:hypothetical protein
MENIVPITPPKLPTTPPKLKQPLSETVVRRNTKMLAAITKAHAEGKTKLVRHLVGQYLKSHDAKLVAAKEALQKLRLPVSKIEIEAVASRLLPWEGSPEPVRLFLQKKGETGNYRSIMSFGVENRSLQYLVKAALMATADLHPHQYASLGVHAAIAHIAKLMEQGHVWSFEIDIENCFPSFEEERLYEFLPLPKEVIRNVIMASHLNVVAGNLHDLFGPAENGVDPILVTEALAAARRGIPQGSAVSNIVAEILLSGPFYALLANGTAIGYADNTLLMATNEQDAVSITEAFGSAIKAHPVGLLRPKSKGSSTPGQPINFLGYQLTLIDGRVKIEPTPSNAAEFHEVMTTGLLRLQKSKLPPPQRLVKASNLRRKVRSWTGQFQLCDGIADQRAYWLSKIGHAYHQG